MSSIPTDVANLMELPHICTQCDLKFHNAEQLGQHQKTCLCFASPSSSSPILILPSQHEYDEMSARQQARIPSDDYIDIESIDFEPMDFGEAVSLEKCVFSKQSNDSRHQKVGSFCDVILSRTDKQPVNSISYDDNTHNNLLLNSSSAIEWTSKDSLPQARDIIRPSTVGSSVLNPDIEPLCSNIKAEPFPVVDLNSKALEEVPMEKQPEKLLVNEKRKRSPPPLEEESSMNPSKKKYKINLSRFSNEQIIAKLAERQAMFVCSCGMMFKDMRLYYLHRGCHDVTNPMRCGLCGQQMADWFSFTSHFYKHSKKQQK